MRRRQFGLGLLALPALTRAASATEASGVRIGMQRALSNLPLLVMRHQALVESHAKKLGLPSLRVEWVTPRDTGETIDFLLSGQLDFGVMSLPELARLWERTAGRPGEMRALSALANQPFLLVTYNKAVKTLADFGDGDSIAVPVVQNSVQAVCLEMAAARLWGLERFTRLDPLTVSLSDAEAAASVVRHRLAVNSHFSVSPYYYDELATPGVHFVLKSSKVVGGPHVNRLLVIAPYFHAGNPTICQAVLRAQQEATALIKKFPRDAAQMYLELTRDDRKPDNVADLIADPDITWSTLPQRSMVFAAFMHKVGRLQRVPASWKDLFLPENQSGEGS